MKVSIAGAILTLVAIQSCGRAETDAKDATLAIRIWSTLECDSSGKRLKFNPKSRQFQIVSGK